MRLEVDSIASGFSPLNVNAVIENNQEKFAEYLNAGVKAAQSGDRKGARKNLMSALDIDPQSENAWLWLASISEYPEELLVFLNNVLDINPKNERALQWSASTKLLLSKTLVQRGIDAHENGRHDFAVQCFDQALSYDTHNVTAWLWLAALNDSEECRLEYFRRVLEIDPDNETAKAAVQAAEHSKRETLFANAAWCALNNDVEGAIDFIGRVLERWPDDKDSWHLRSHLAISLDDRRSAWKRILEIDPDDNFARTNLESLDVLVQSARTPASESSVKDDSASQAVDEKTDLSVVEFVPETSVLTEDEAEPNPTAELTEHDAYVADDQHIEVLDPPTNHFEAEQTVESHDDSHEIHATIYEPGDFEPSAEFSDHANDPFSSLAEPVDHTEVAVVDDRLKILVVQNNPTARKLMAGKLENSGYNVVCAESGREAVELVRSCKPSLVLADIAMPGMDGYAICRSVRDMELHDLPIILISGKDGYYEEELGEAAGASGFITKPFGPETLMKTIENFLAAAPNH